MTPQEIRIIKAILDVDNRQLSEMMGVSQQTVSYWASGARNMPEPERRLLLRILDERNVPEDKWRIVEV